MRSCSGRTGPLILRAELRRRPECRGKGRLRPQRRCDGAVQPAVSSPTSGSLPDRTRKPARGAIRFALLPMSGRVSIPPAQSNSDQHKMRQAMLRRHPCGPGVGLAGHPCVVQCGPRPAFTTVARARTAMKAQAGASGNQKRLRSNERSAGDVMDSLHPGQIILHYRIVDKIGQGGMGEVYQAEDLKLGRRVAIKRLPVEDNQDHKAKQRFQREARSASTINHPHIVTIYAIEETDGFDFIVMEYVEGESLRETITRGPLAWSQLVEAGLQIADALAAAHSIGLIHRDIKSANILLTSRGQVKVLDFGLAKMIRPFTEEAPTTSGVLTDRGIIIGTVAYMSPEQTRGEALDPRSDLFSLGVVLYEAATGRLPFSGPSVLSMMHEIAANDPPSPCTLQRDLPREFDVVIERALAKDREQRYPSASEMMAALQALRGSGSDQRTAFTTAETATPPSEPG